MKPEPMTDEQIDGVPYIGKLSDEGLRKFARAIEAAVNAKWEAMLAAPYKAKTEAEKTAYAFGFLKALEMVREKT